MKATFCAANSILTVHVLQEFRQIEKLRNELFDVIGVFVDGAPSAWNGVELSIGHIEPITL